MDDFDILFSLGFDLEKFSKVKEDSYKEIQDLMKNEPQFSIGLIHHLANNNDLFQEKVNKYTGTNRRKLIDKIISINQEILNYDYKDKILKTCLEENEIAIKQNIQYWENEKFKFSEKALMESDNNRISLIEIELNMFIDDVLNSLNSAKRYAIAKNTNKAIIIKNKDFNIFKYDINQKINFSIELLQYIYGWMVLESKKELIYVIMRELKSISNYINDIDINKTIIHTQIIKIKKLTYNDEELQDLINSDKFRKPNESKHPSTFNPNEFNNDGFELFKYLVENYVLSGKEHGRKKRFSNVWHFMKNDNYSNDFYKIYFTKKDYKSYIKKNYNEVLKNMDKNEDKYIRDELIKLKDHLKNFKQIY
jgi:hypothetical protein